MDPNDNNTDLTPTQDDLEWGQAAENFAAEKDVKLGDPVAKKKTDDDDDNAGGENAQTTEQKAAADKEAADKVAADKKAADDAEAAKAATETPEQTEARHKKEKEEADARAAAEEANKPVNPEFRAARQTQREIAQAEEAMKADVRKELYPDLQTEILDADGDPVRTIEDAMKLMNPNTKKAFTEEEAAKYLLDMSAYLKKENDKATKEIEKVAAVNLDLYDQRDNVKEKYGALLKSMPDVAKRIVLAYNKTLVMDSKQQFVLEAPVNMEEFFDIALEPYQKTAQQMTDQKAADDKAAAEAKAQKDKERKQTRQDRSDIYGGGKADSMDDDEKEWAQAAKAHYGK